MRAGGEEEMHAGDPKVPGHVMGGTAYWPTGGRM